MLYVVQKCDNYIKVMQQACEVLNTAYSPERQSARMSKITNNGLTSGHSAYMNIPKYKISIIQAQRPVLKISHQKQPLRTRTK